MAGPLPARTWQPACALASQSQVLTSTQQPSALPDKWLHCTLQLHGFLCGWHLQAGASTASLYSPAVPQRPRQGCTSSLQQAAAQTPSAEELTASRCPVQAPRQSTVRGSGPTAWGPAREWSWPTSSGCPATFCYECPRWQAWWPRWTPTPSLGQLPAPLCASPRGKPGRPARGCARSRPTCTSSAARTCTT